MGKAMATQTLVLPEHIYTGWVGSSDGHEHLIKLIFLVIPQGTSFKKTVIERQAFQWKLPGLNQI